jgi:hypothetical protein
MQTLAHEAAHTVQQAAGPVDGTASPGGVSISDPSDRFEQAAQHAAVGAMMSDGAGGTAGHGATPVVQRQDASEDEESLDKLTQENEEELSG